ncbi:MAG: hypothetical protein PF693_07255 [Spirochaetia bacterium]|jgi:tetratricopeptide (TPR) repeat protein|nr:hypothetical protein [Spirochaetia bacterium]
MRSKTLKKASKYFNSGKYNKVLQILEPQVCRYRQDFDFFYFLGISCLNTADFGGGYSYLQRAIDIKPDDINTIAGLALVHLKRQENSEAIQEWFKILDLDPKNKLAKKGLESLKKYSKQEDFVEYLESGKYLNLVPGRNKLATIIKITYFSLLFLVFFTFISFYIYNIIIQPAIKRPEISAVKLNNFGSLTNNDIKSYYQFSDKKIRRVFELIREYFDNYQDNLAMREINRLLLSNADELTKEKVILLSSYISIPGFSTLKTNYSYQEFLQEPKIYQNCYVHWKGRLSNLITNDNHIMFDFLVGYDDKKILEGIIPVTLNFGARIDSNFPIEVLGKIINTENEYVLEAISVHQYQ